MNKGFYSRGYLPHWDFKNATQAVTFRLNDCLPAHLIKGWRKDLEEIEDDKIRERDLRRLVARYEDAGYGSCVLRQDACAIIIQDELLKDHENTYKLLEWCVMPNHVHVMFRSLNETPMDKILNSWKGSSSRKINQLLGLSGKLWQREFYDRLVRDEDHYYACRRYIRNNPVKAGLCEKPEDWRFSSAYGAPPSGGESPDETTDAS